MTNIFPNSLRYPNHRPNSRNPLVSFLLYITPATQTIDKYSPLFTHLKRYTLKKMGFSTTSDSESNIPSPSGYFNNIFKTHLYYRRSGSRDMKSTEKENEIEVRKRNIAQRIKISKVGYVTNASRPKEQRIQCNETMSQVEPLIVKKINNHPPTSSTPSEYKFKNTSIVKRGKFKKRFDDRYIRCVYHNNSLYDDLMKEDDMDCHKQRHCYCSYLPIVKSPLRQSYPPMTLEHRVSFAEDVKSNSLTRNFNPDVFSCNENTNSQKIFKGEGHIISRVRNKFGSNTNVISGGELSFNEHIYDRYFNNKKVKRIHSMSSLKSQPLLKPTIELKKDYQITDDIPGNYSSNGKKAEFIMV